jgi:type I restriction enzyme S subunit
VRDETFLSSWQQCRFDSVARVISGKNQRDVECPSGPYPIYGSGGAFGKSTGYLCEAGTIVIGRKGTINSPIFVNERFWNVDTAFGLCPIDSNALLPLFLYYFCRGFNFAKLDKSTTIPSLAKRDIEAINFPLPPLAEQKRIVAKIEELFSELDAGEERLRKARRQLGVYRQSLLKQAFEGKLTAQWRTQHPDLLSSPDQLLARIQAERQARYQQQLKEWEKAVKEWEEAATDEKRPPKPQKLTPSNDSIPVFDVDFPTGWCVLNLSQFVLELGQGWSPKCDNRPAEDGEWAVIKTTAIQSGDFAPSANKALPKHLPPRRWLALRAGEILITRAGPRSRCGVVCRVRADQPQLMLCDKAYRLVLSESATSSEYFERLLCSPAAMAAIEELKTGINDSGVNITQTAFLQLALPIPSLPEQQEIVRLLDEQFEVIERNEREIDAALCRSEALRQAILKKAFTGQLVPQDPADEPASELLTRLRAQKQPKPIRQSKKNA